MALAIKRLVKDLKDLEKNSLKDNGIFHIFNEDNIFNVKALIIGPEDTPYEKGFFFFDIIVGEEYPFKPPTVKFCTQNGNIRYNPNLYVNGKVCLSILNTWDGPKWTSTQSLASILLTLQSIINEYPIQNEPGFEKETGIKSINYNEVIQHETLRFCVFEQIKSPPNSFEVFKPIMEQFFIQNFDWYLNKLQKLSEKYNKKQYFVSQVYALQCQNTYSELLTECVNRYTFLREKYEIDSFTDYKNIKKNEESTKKYNEIQ